MGVLRSTRESGQILLIVVLAAVISLTVGLSVASRVITNTRTTTDQVNAQKALSAAEAGVEQSLKSFSASSGTFTGTNNKYTATPQQIKNSQFLVNGGNLVAQDDGADIWLSDHDPVKWVNQRNATLRIYWKIDSSCTKTPALELIVLSGAVANPDLHRYVYDTCGRVTATPDTANNADGKKISGITFDRYAQVDVQNGLLARVIPLYTSATVGVELFNYQSVPNAISNPPVQGYLIESTGQSGNVTRTLRVFQGFPKLPTELFPYTLFIP
jgi:hypothetical protein